MQTHTCMFKVSDTHPYQCSPTPHIHTRACKQSPTHLRFFLHASPTHSKHNTHAHIPSIHPIPPLLLLSMHPYLAVGSGGWAAPAGAAPRHTPACSTSRTRSRSVAMETWSGPCRRCCCCLRRRRCCCCCGFHRRGCCCCHRACRSLPLVRWWLEEKREGKKGWEGGMWRGSDGWRERAVAGKRGEREGNKII